VRERTVAVNGIELFVTEAGPADGSLVVLCHGFPELGFSWRHQIPALVEAGYLVAAPDQRGYGRTTAPEAVTDYDIVHLTGDLAGLLDQYGREKAVFVGHDWGSMVVWAMALRHPDRVAGVVGMSVPFVPRGEVAPTQAIRALLGEAFFYMLYFQEPGVADADLGADPARFLRRMMAGIGSGTRDPDAVASMFANDGRGFVDRLPEPGELPEWLSQEELDHCVDEFTRTGFTGALNWYRNLDRNWELSEHLAGAKVTVPAKFIGGVDDPVLVMTPPALQDGHLVDDRGTVLIQGAGHWVQQEKPDEVNNALLDFLGGLEPGW
jgi:pimeloyl-ACP methyl ester carboxylesterase